MKINSNFTNVFKLTCLLFLIMEVSTGWSQNHPGVREYQTYCNPIDIDYTYVAHNAYTEISYRAGADPAVVNFKGKYYMFVTRSHGYWVSDDMSNWEFVTPQNWYFNGSNAPAAAVSGDEVLVAGDPSGRMAVIKTRNPLVGDWKTQYAVLPLKIQDPALFVDEDKKVYLYEESSNKHPLYGVELDPENHYLPKGEEKPLIRLQPGERGWERFGQDHNSELAPYLEGPWMTKHEGRYYLQYGAPGTEFNVYADGVYIGDDPLGPFEYAPYNPISYKPEGFISGAGHGSTVQDGNGNFWHFATMPIAVNYKFERRIGLFPSGFEDDGQMYVNTAYGDYPHYLPDTVVENHKNRFTGWMLASYGKQVKASSVLDKNVEQKVIGPEMETIKRESAAGYGPDNVVDENIDTFWVAGEDDSDPWISMDLGEEMKIYALQVNFHEFNADIFGRVPGLRHQFVIESSDDGQDWTVLVDYSGNERDQPHAYIELKIPTETRFFRIKNISHHNRHLAISGFRIFGKGVGGLPNAPGAFRVERRQDRRNADLTWETVKGATGYVVYWGIDKNKLNNSVLIYEKSEYALRALTKDQSYYFQVEAFNENGISEKSSISQVD